MNPLYLASGSPRRRELLTQIGVPFSVISAPIDETPLADESAQAYVERLARAKAAAGLGCLAHPDNATAPERRAVVLGADTAVVLEGVFWVNRKAAKMPWPCWLIWLAASTRC